MTDTTLRTILEYTPSIIGAILAGTATIVSSRALKKGQENGDKSDKIIHKADIIAAKTNEIHAITNGTFSDVKQDLREANKAIIDIHANNESKVLDILNQHQKTLNRIDTDLSRLSNEMRSVRERQHDLASFLQGVGLKYELKPIEEAEKKEK